MIDLITPPVVTGSVQNRLFTFDWGGALEGLL